MEKYLATIAKFDYQSSRGCPHRCSYCAEVSLFQRTWRSKPASVMIEEIEYIIEKFNPGRIYFVDSNFFCNKNRVENFCNMVIKRELKTKFFAECRFDYFYKYDYKFINLLKQAGFYEIEFGGESGSDITLSYIKKDIVSDFIIKSIEKCKAVGLKSFTSFMIGFPGESCEEMMKTLDIYDQIMVIDPKGARINGLFIYTPFPGTELYETVLKEWGYNPPRSLEEWADFELYDSSDITWLNKNEKKRLQTISIMVRYFFIYKTIKNWTFKEMLKRHNGILKTLGSVIFNGCYFPIAKLRWKFRIFNYGYEWRLWQKVMNIYTGRK